jgi:hypothetical protein
MQSGLNGVKAGIFRCGILQMQNTVRAPTQWGKPKGMTAMEPNVGQWASAGTGSTILIVYFYVKENGGIGWRFSRLGDELSKEKPTK